MNLTNNLRRKQKNICASCSRIQIKENRGERLYAYSRARGGHVRPAGGRLPPQVLKRQRRASVRQLVGWLPARYYQTTRFFSIYFSKFRHIFGKRLIPSVNFGIFVIQFFRIDAKKEETEEAEDAEDAEETEE